MTQVYSCTQSRPLSLAAPHDPNAEEYYTLIYIAASWQSDIPYVEKIDCDEVGDFVSPLVENGFAYECVSTGISGSVEPTWPTVKDQTVDDNTVKWKAVPYLHNLKSGETITSSDWETDNADIVLSDKGISNGRTFVKVSNVPVNIETFTLTNRVTIQRIGGIIEILDRSLKIKVREM